MRVSICVLALGLFLGCSGGGRTPVPGSQCSINYQPVKRAIQEENKVSLAPDAGGHIALPPGKYQYNWSDLYYEDAAPVATSASSPAPAPDQNYRVHIRDQWDDKLKVFKPMVACVRNAKVGLAQKNLAVHTRGINGLKVAPDGTLSPGDLSVRNYGFAIDEDGSMNLGFTPSAEKLADPSTIASGSYIYVHPDNHDVIEVRSEGQSTNGGRWILSNTFVRTDAN